jgi:uncharacterized protein YbjT (DUF2867 family)
MLSTINADKAQYALAKQFKGLEKYISSNAPYYCVLRTTPFLDLLLLHAEEIRESKTLTMVLSKDASFAPIDTKDVARAVACILLNAGPHHGQIHELTGPSCKVIVFLFFCQYSYSYFE